MSTAALIVGMVIGFILVVVGFVQLHYAVRGKRRGRIWLFLFLIIGASYGTSLAMTNLQLAYIAEAMKRQVGLQ